MHNEFILIYKGVIQALNSVSGGFCTAFAAGDKLFDKMFFQSQTGTVTAPLILVASSASTLVYAAKLDGEAMQITQVGLRSEDGTTVDCAILDTALEYGGGELVTLAMVYLSVTSTAATLVGKLPWLVLAKEYCPQKVALGFGSTAESLNDYASAADKITGGCGFSNGAYRLQAELTAAKNYPFAAFYVDEKPFAVIGGDQTTTASQAVQVKKNTIAFDVGTAFTVNSVDGNSLSASDYALRLRGTRIGAEKTLPLLHRPKSGGFKSCGNYTAVLSNYGVIVYDKSFNPLTPFIAAGGGIKDFHVGCNHLSVLFDSGAAKLYSIADSGLTLKCEMSGLSAYSRTFVFDGGYLAAFASASETVVYSVNSGSASVLRTFDCQASAAACDPETGALISCSATTDYAACATSAHGLSFVSGARSATISIAAGVVCGYRLIAAASGLTLYIKDMGTATVHAVSVSGATALKAFDGLKYMLAKTSGGVTLYALNRTNFTKSVIVADLEGELGEYTVSGNRLIRINSGVATCREIDENIREAVFRSYLSGTAQVQTTAKSFSSGIVKMTFSAVL